MICDRRLGARRPSLQRVIAPAFGSQAVLLDARAAANGPNISRLRAVLRCWATVDARVF